MALAQDHLEPFAVCYQKAVDRLHRVSSPMCSGGWSLSRLQLVVEHEYSATYAYYKVPSPWLQVKLLKLLQYYPPSGSSRSMAVLTQRLIAM
jgi:AP-2 complex subunit alpha